MNAQEEIDLTLAIQLQAQFEEELRKARETSYDVVPFQSKAKQSPKGKSKREESQEKLSVSLVDPSWEVIDPNPNIHELFITFNQQFFWGTLHMVEVKWSPRMTLCAGVCSYEGRGGLCSVRLSVPLLKLRPRKDLVETLLHEMIHAYLFVADRDRDRDGHGPKFHEHMYRINRIAGTNISVYHSFHDEVNAYRQHVWQCDGPCRRRPPYYGLVKRSMNRAPSARDPWWGRHLNSCGGNYTKIKEPEGYGKKRKKSPLGDKNKKFGDITKYVDRKSTGKQEKENVEDAKKPKINGFNAAGSGTVNSIGVNRASNANVVGFQKTLNGNKNINNKSENNFKSKNFSGSQIASKGRGSTTITVKGKSKEDDQDIKTKQSQSEVNPFSVFTGNGFSLGASSSQPGVSRLLNLSNNKSSKDKEQTQKIPPNSRLLNSSSKDKSCVTKKSIDTDDVSCPLCNTKVKSDNLDDHISECVGSIDDDFFIEEVKINSNPSKVLNNSIEVISENKNASKLTIKKENPPVEIIESDIKVVSYPCPVCSENFQEKYMNSHLDTHFK